MKNSGNTSNGSQRDNYFETCNPILSIVVPAYNEQEVLPEFHKCLSGVLNSISLPAEIIYINDGSTDVTLSILKTLHENDDRIAIVDLSRNFGKEIAMTAGLDHAQGEAVIVIDADLQDPPELIPDLLEQWKNGFDVVYAQRISRDGETIIKKATAHTFYRVLQKVSNVKIPQDTGDYRLLSRRAVDSLKQLPEHHRYMKGLFSWIGYPQKAVKYRRNPRFIGKTKWNYWKLWNFALEGITSFTIAPLKLATYIGIICSLTAFAYGLYVIVKTLLFGDPVAGYPSLMVVISFFSGIQLMTLGVIGEYLGRMFDETKRRPLYFLNDFHPPRFFRKSSG